MGFWEPFGRGEWGGWLAGWVGWVGWLFFGGREGEVLQFLYIQTPDRPLQRLLLVIVYHVIHGNSYYASRFILHIA